MKNAVVVLLAIAGAFVAGSIWGSCSADARADEADARADVLEAASREMSRQRTDDSTRFVQDSARLADSVRVLETSLATERARTAAAEETHREAIDLSELATADFQQALETALPLLPDTVASALREKRARELETWTAERVASNAVAAQLRKENDRLGKLLALSRAETANALLDRDGERTLRLQETARADGLRDARDAWRRAAGRWRITGIATAVVALGVAAALVF